MRKERKHFTPEEKVTILRRHLVYARGAGPGPLAFGNARLVDRRASRRWLFCREGVQAPSGDRSGLTSYLTSSIISVRFENDEVAAPGRESAL